MFRSRNGFFRFDAANHRHVVEGIVAFAAHTIEQREERRVGRPQVLTRKFDDGLMMPQLHPRSLAMAQHQRQRCLDHCLIRNLVRGLFIDEQVLSGGDRLAPGVGEEQVNLLRVYFLRTCLRWRQSDGSCCPARYR